MLVWLNFFIWLHMHYLSVSMVSFSVFIYSSCFGFIFLASATPLLKDYVSKAVNCIWYGPIHLSLYND